jgi:hypothetical protein
LVDQWWYYYGVSLLLLLFHLLFRREEKRERERESMYINTKEMRENSFKEVWPFFLFFSFSLQLFFKATDEFALNFFSRKNLLSQTTEQF